MKKRLLFLVLILSSSGFFSNSYAQTCTISCGPTPCTVLWINSPATCSSAGTIVIPAGVTLEFDNVADTWTGSLIDVYGTLLINQADININASLRVRSGGLVTIGKKLSLGTSPTNPTGCNFTVIIDSGGKIDVTSTGTDRLSICGSSIMKGAGSCNDCGGTNSGTCAYNGQPYCEPAAGFVGPLGYSKDGFDSSLPIELLSFKASKGINKISLTWATASELNFDYFDVEKSSEGTNFYSIAKVKGNGTTHIRQDYSFNDEKPLSGKNYYRLKSVDFDGYTEYFNVIMIDFDGKKDFFIYPSPSNGLTFNLETNFIPNNNSFVVLYSTTGAEIARFKVNGEVSTLTLPVKLESGWYYAKFLSSEFTSVSRILVK